MTKTKSIIQILKNDLPYLKDNYKVKRLGVFGSFAQGRQKKGSDIDVIVEFQKPLGLNFIDFADHLEHLLGRKIDILTSEGVKGIRIKEVARDIKRGTIYV